MGRLETTPGKDDLLPGEVEEDLRSNTEEEELKEDENDRATVYDSEER